MPTVILTLPGIIVSTVLFVLFYRNRKQELWIRRRILVLFVLILVHTTLLWPLSVLFETGLPWISLIPVLLIVMIFYLVHFNEWKNRDLRIATVAFAVYPMFFLLLAVLASLLVATI